MADVQIAVIDQQNTEVTIAVPGVQGPVGQTGDVAVAQDGTAAQPGIRFENDTNTGIYRPGADQVAVATNGTGRLFVDASGNVGVGGSPSARFEVTTGAGTEARITSTIDNNADLTFYTNGVQRGIVEGNSLGMLLGTTGALPTFFVTNNAERLRIDSSGRLLVGTSSAKTASKPFLGTSAPVTPISQIEGYQIYNDEASRCFMLRGNSATDIVFPYFALVRSKGTALGSNTVVANNDILGALSFQGMDGTNPVEAAAISVAVDGTPCANDMPGRLVFSTTADGASSPTQRMTIASTGEVIFTKTTSSFSTPGFVFAPGGSADFVRNGSVVFAVNRLANDGDLVAFFQDTTQEGTISVSGTTVSYNGAHLSRWSQLPSGAERTEILRGTVLSNINEMCEWGDEDNEQLNRMKVSDVEGDKNVSGVFQCWDDDDDTYTNDFYCAMTGDFIIRIAEGVTVERGDLLMSAGDGTAKPQDDDIIRSKTIAKVTSTNVSCTYADGSYCVPCVLMAC